MELKSYDSYLTDTCDDFDESISPKTIARSNTNIIYLIFKSIAKGWEIINNVCVALSNKFNPALCSEDDLVSVGKIVGTKQRPGSVSGLRISVYNSSSQSAVLPAGTYVYRLSDEAVFSFTTTEDTEIASETSVYFTALSGSVGAYRVTQQTNIAVSSDDAEIPSVFTFSCSDNLRLLGKTEESVLEFRQRVLTDTERQDAISELKEKILSLPYVYDCVLVFNKSESPATVGDYTVPPYYLLIMLSTAKYDNEIAKIVAENSIYPTAGDENSHEVVYESSVFADGQYSVLLNDFMLKDFAITLSLRVDTNYASRSVLQDQITSALQNAFNTNIHRDFITAEDVFIEIGKLNLAGVKVLDIDFTVEGAPAEYVSFLRTELPNLVTVGGI